MSSSKSWLKSFSGLLCKNCIETSSALRRQKGCVEEVNPYSGSATELLTVSFKA